jgi:hypothetical protein
VSFAALGLPTRRKFQPLTKCLQATNPTVIHKTVTVTTAIAAPKHTTTDRSNVCATAPAVEAMSTAATTRAATAYTHNTATTSPTILSTPAKPTAPTPPALGPTAPIQAARTALSTASTLSKKTYTAGKTATVAADSRARSRKTANTTHSNSKATAVAVQCSRPAVRGNPLLWAAVASPTSPRLQGATCLRPHARSRRRRRAGSRGVSARRSRSSRIGRQISFLRWIQQDTRISSAWKNNV